MIALALVLAAPAGACLPDRHLPTALERWRYVESAGDVYPFSRGIYGDGGSGSFDYTDLPAEVGPSQIRHFLVSRAGAYAVARDTIAPVVLYSARRDAAGKRVAVAPVARRGGPACTSIAAVDLYRLAPGDYYAVTPRPPRGVARTLVTRLD